MEVTQAGGPLPPRPHPPPRQPPPLPPHAPAPAAPTTQVEPETVTVYPAAGVGTAVIAGVIVLVTVTVKRHDGVMVLSMVVELVTLPSVVYWRKVEVWVVVVAGCRMVVVTVAVVPQGVVKVLAGRVVLVVSWAVDVTASGEGG